MSYKHEYLDDLINNSTFIPGFNDLDDMQLKDSGCNKFRMKLYSTPLKNSSDVQTSRSKQRSKSMACYGRSVTKSLVYYHSLNNIRDATNGSFTKYKTGSSFEDMFFKVKILDPSISVKENRLRPLFFRCPEEFERLFECTVDSKIKEAWKQRCIMTEYRLRNSEK